MNDPTELVLAAVAIATIALNAIQFILGARGRDAAAAADEADAIEKLSQRVQALEEALDLERKKRRAAEDKVDDLANRLVKLEVDNRRLTAENEALRSLLSEQ